MEGMVIAKTRFWVDRTSNQIGIRSYNDSSQPFECSLSKYVRLLDCNIYETGDEWDRPEFRLSFRLLWFSLNALLWKGRGKTRAGCEDGRGWGWYFMDRRSLTLKWGRHYKSFDLPFISLVFVNHELLSLSRHRVIYIYPRMGAYDSPEYQKREEIKAANTASFPYRYELLNGEAQEVTAKVNVERRTWRWKWTPFKHVRDSIDVHFSEEVGPERGSWKGGCIGCGYDLKKGETVVQCLRRMERDRRFER